MDPLDDLFQCLAAWAARHGTAAVVVAAPGDALTVLRCGVTPDTARDWLRRAAVIAAPAAADADA